MQSIFIADEILNFPIDIFIEISFNFYSQYQYHLLLLLNCCHNFTMYKQKLVEILDNQSTQLWSYNLIHIFRMDDGLYAK